MDINTPVWRMWSSEWETICVCRLTCHILGPPPPPRTNIREISTLAGTTLGALYLGLNCCVRSQKSWSSEQQTTTNKNTMTITYIYIYARHTHTDTLTLTHTHSHHRPRWACCFHCKRCTTGRYALFEALRWSAFRWTSSCANPKVFGSIMGRAAWSERTRPSITNIDPTIGFRGKKHVRFCFWNIIRRKKSCALGLRFPISISAKLDRHWLGQALICFFLSLTLWGGKLSSKFLC